VITWFTRWRPLNGRLNCVRSVGHGSACVRRLSLWPTPYAGLACDMTSASEVAVSGLRRSTSVICLCLPYYRKCSGTFWLAVPLTFKLLLCMPILLCVFAIFVSVYILSEPSPLLLWICRTNPPCFLTSSHKMLRGD